jgi:cobalamin-dependent methionine synthase I
MYSLISQDTEETVAEFDKFDKDAIKKAIIDHLTANRGDVLEYHKKYNEAEAKIYAGGSKILDFYQANPVNGRISKAIVRGNREFFHPIDDEYPSISS